MTNIIDDISTLTTIPKTTIENLMDVEAVAISHCVYESLCNELCETDVDIGIGILHISYVGDEIKLKLDPSPKFTNLLVLCSMKDTDPLTLKIDTSLRAKIDRIYKDLM